MTVKFEHIGTLDTSTGSIVICDPCYLDDAATVRRLGAEVKVNWHRRGILEAHVYAVLGPRYDGIIGESDRALVVTDGSEPPAELLEARLPVGQEWHTVIGVDSGMIGAFIRLPDNDYFGHERSTYLGDGQYPVKLYFDDTRKLKAIAALTDQSYYDPGWQRD